MFAEAMYAFATESGMLATDAPFVRFNCADYADNPQLLVAQIFGVKKGAFSGADADKRGLIAEADGGIFFLDEIHRLSPQGQELLFTFIDKGVYRPLGYTGEMRTAAVQIIAATTENPDSVLLDTFTRRIPMTIVLPPLRSRSLEERFSLVQGFLCAEATRLGHEIYVEHNAVLSFLLYDCPNNIGQLKSDIQLACAQAFLEHRSENQPYILIRQQELEGRVKRGILRLSEECSSVQRFLDQTEDIMVFRPGGEPIYSEPEAAAEQTDFYEGIATSAERLRRQGMSESEVRSLIHVDIEKHFRRYLADLPDRFRREELLKVVPAEIVDLTERMLVEAERELARDVGERVYYGLALHLAKSVERIRYGAPIFYPHLGRVRKQHIAEFRTAMQLGHIIEHELGIEVPLDEIGYITMFLIPPEARLEQELQAQVAVVVLMHGTGVARGMADVANTFAGGEIVRSLDMPLSMKVDDSYRALKELLLPLNRERGVLLLVDMGSLNNFAAMLHDDIGGEVRSLDMVSTPLVIEAARRAMEGATLDDIYRDLREGGGRYQLQQVNRAPADKREFLIVTACFTGAGAASYLKDYLTQQLADAEVTIEALNILDRNDFYCRLQSLSQRYTIVAVVGTVTFPVEGVPLFTAADILAPDGVEISRAELSERRDYERIRVSLQAHLEGLDVGRGMDGALLFLRVMRSRLQLTLSQDVCMGIVIHILFMLDRVVSGREGREFADAASYEAANSSAFTVAREAFAALERAYSIKIPLSELAYVVRMCIENKE